MSPTRTMLGVTRALVGLGSWFAPDLTVRIFGIETTRSGRFVTRLFGARELALAGALLVAPPRFLKPIALLGAGTDAVDAVAGFDELRRGNLSRRATVLGPIGALAFLAAGLRVGRVASRPPA